MNTPTTILLFGFTHSSIEIARQLQDKNHAFMLVDNDCSLLEKAHALGFELMIVDYTDDEVLQKLGIGTHISFIFTLFEDDAKNVFLTLSARSLDPKLHIVAMTHTKDAIHKLEIAGASTILDPYQISGKKIRLLA